MRTSYRSSYVKTDYSYLHPRQWEILRLIALGWSNAAIAVDQEIAHNTLAVHISIIYRYLKMRGRDQASRRVRVARWYWQRFEQYGISWQDTEDVSKARNGPLKTQLLKKESKIV